MPAARRRRLDGGAAHVAPICDCARIDKFIAWLSATSVRSTTVDADSHVTVLWDKLNLTKLPSSCRDDLAHACAGSLGCFAF